MNKNTRPSYEDNVFINCPFDPPYEPLFHAAVFAIHDCSFNPRCALEISNSAQNRLQKILEMISQCKYGVHDISRTELDSQTRLPRFNMPLELGIFLGSQYFGSDEQKAKVCLIMDKDKHGYRKSTSDISGQDIIAHGDSPEKIIKEIRDWLKTAARQKNLPGGAKMHERYIEFRKQLPLFCKERHIKLEEMTFIDFSEAVSIWLEVNPLYANK